MTTFDTPLLSANGYATAHPVLTPPRPAPERPPAPPALPSSPTIAPAPTRSGKDESRPPLMFTVIALLGAGLSFNFVRLEATPVAGFYGGIATALLFDAGMWLSSRWYIRTVRGGRPLRPALWLSLFLVAATLVVNVAPARTLPEVIVHGIGPALFAAFTWLEAALVLREYQKKNPGRDRIPLGYALAHPLRTLRITVMMLGADEKSFTRASAMCQNREAQRRSWKAQHRPRWIRFATRALRPGWRGKVDPVLYTAYRWGRFDTSALILPSLGAVRPGVGAVTADGSAMGGLAGPFAPTLPAIGPAPADRVAAAIERALAPAVRPVAGPLVGGASRPPRIRPARRAYRQVTGRMGGQGSATGRPTQKQGGGQNPATPPERTPGTATDIGRKVAALAAKNPDWKPSRVAAALHIGERTARRHMTGK
jgi:hypothetical protein